MKTENSESTPNITKLKELTYEIKISQAMTKDVVTVSPDTSMCELRDVLRINRISGTPVVENGQMIGIISIEDLIKTMGVCGPVSEIKNGAIAESVQDKMGNIAVREHMTMDPETLYDDEPLAFAVRKFTEFHFGRFPVINRAGKLVGIITQGNIVEAVLDRLEAAYSEIEVLNYPTGYFFSDILADEFSLTLQYHVTAEDFDNAGEASSRLKKTLSHLCIHPHIIRRISIAAYEAEINLVLWGKGGEMRVEIQPNQIILETIDSGPGIEDIEQAMQPGYSSAPEWVRSLGFGAGMGLPNIQSCTDEMELKSTPNEGTHLKTIIYLTEE